MQYWIELSLGLAAGVAVVFMTFEGVRIYSAWRRSDSRAANP